MAQVPGLDSAGRDTAYVRTILERSAGVTDALGITGSEDGDRILNIVANRYFALSDIYAERDSARALAEGLEGVERRQALEAAEALKDSRLYRSHFGFLADLALTLDGAQVERVKDALTYNVVWVTYEAQCDMIPTLEEEEKAQILAWLKEAREYAMDGESSKAKHETFGKYKGRINNYLSNRGYDLARERRDWEERVKERGGTL